MRVFILTLFIQIIGLLILPTGVAAQNQNDNGKPAADAAYRIQKGDKLSVKFFSHPELSEPTVVVRPDGFISLQIIDDIKADGRTATELKNDLLEAYSETLLNPIISVAVIEFVPPRVFIGGQVFKPGRYDLRDARTVVQVVFLAGGFTGDANRKLVVLARADGSGGWQTQAVNVLKILDRKSKEKDINLQDGDYVFIPDSKISQFNKAVQSFNVLLPVFLRR